jgi:septum formation protein
MILASASPRRAAILKALGCPFEAIAPNTEVGEYGVWDGGARLRARAQDKGAQLKGEYPERLILSADTIVLLDTNVLGKPRDIGDAESMLHLLSGKMHQVWTAVCLFRPAKQGLRSGLCSSNVWFRNLTDAQIRAYVETGEPMDKAGAYGIQGLGGLWVKKIEGCYFNVVGLPVAELWELLELGPIQR